MRAIDCEQGHDKIHITADNDEELFEKVKAHATEYHPALSEEEMRGMLTQMAYDE